MNDDGVVDMETVRATLEHLGFNDVPDEMLEAYIEKLLAQHEDPTSEHDQHADRKDEQIEEQHNFSYQSPETTPKRGLGLSSKLPSLQMQEEPQNSSYHSPETTPNRGLGLSSNVASIQRQEVEDLNLRNPRVSPRNENFEEKVHQVPSYSEKLDSCRDLIQEAREMLERRDQIDRVLERRREDLPERELGSYCEMKDFSRESSPASTLRMYEAELDYEDEYVPKVAYKLSSKEIRLKDRNKRRKKKKGYRSTDPVALAQKYRQGWKRHGIR